MTRRVALACLGLTGSLLVALTGPRLMGGGRAITWWFSPRLAAGHGGNSLIFYGGMVALTVAWLGLGRLARTDGMRPRELYIIAALWCLPLVAGPPLFSHDVYSYLAQGTIAHLGLNPYHDPPTVLGHLGHTHVLETVSPFWRKTTAPYGPLFLGLVSAIVSVTSSTVAGVLLVRALGLVGFVLIAIFVPRLARSLGADPSRAIWLALLSPLVLLELIAAGHNDVLMVGLMVAGLALAQERRPLPGIALCIVAATIKVPAAAAALFIAVAWIRTLPTGSERVKALAQATALAVAVVAVVSIVSGLGFGWISTAVFSTPERVQLAVTPSTALGWTIAHALHDVGISIGRRAFESTLSQLTFMLTVLFGGVLLYRTRVETLVRNLGLLLVAVALCGPAAWPWYFTWGVTLLAACPEAQFSRALAIALALSVFVVKASGMLALPLKTAPWMLALYVVLVLGAWYQWRRRGGVLPSLRESAAPALPEPRVLG